MREDINLANLRGGESSKLPRADVRIAWLYFEAFPPPGDVSLGVARGGLTHQGSLRVGPDLPRLRGHLDRGGRNWRMENKKTLG